MYALPRNSGVEELKEFLNEKPQETCPDSAASTAATGTALRDRFIDLSQWYQGLRDLNINSLWWIGLGFAFTVTTVPQLLPKPSEPFEHGSGISWFNYSGPGALECLHANLSIMHSKKHLWVGWCPWCPTAISVACQSGYLWILTDYRNPVVLGEMSRKEILAVVFSGDRLRLIAVQGHHSQGCSVRPQVL